MNVMFSAINDGLTKKVGQFLIHKYFGDYLKTTIDKNDLNLELVKGKASIENVQLNVDKLNEDLNNGPFHIVDGFVGKVSLVLPFQTFMTESCMFELDSVWVTIVPRDNVASDLIRSVIESVENLESSSIGSEDYSADFGTDLIQQFSEVIQRVVRQIQIEITKLTIRLEIYDSPVSRCIEVVIGSIRYIDEQLEASKNPVQTQQPTTNVNDVCKVIRVSDIEINTDLWTQEISQSSCSTSNNEINVEPVLNEINQSCYQSCYQSCHSHVSSHGTRESDDGRGLIPNSVTIAKLSGESVIKLNIINPKMERAGAFGNNMTVDVQCGGSLLCFITPSQIALVTDILSRFTQPSPGSEDTIVLGGFPMQSTHYDMLSEQFHGIPHGHHAGEGSINEFITNDSHFSFDQVNLNDSHDTETLSLTGTHRGSSCTLVEKPIMHPPDVFILNFKAPYVLCVITHDDPLSTDSVNKARNDYGLNAEIELIAKLKNDSISFFAEASNALQIRNTHDPLYLQRKKFAKSCQGDHLQFLVKDMSVMLKTSKDECRTKLEVATMLPRFDLCECLTSGSVYGHSDGTVIDLFNFGDKSDSLHLEFRIFDGDAARDVTISMQKCRSEVDVSIIDRLHYLFVQRPFFISKLPFAGRRPMANNSVDQISNWSINFVCSQWEVDLKIPVADLSGESALFHQRRVHDDFPRITFNEVHVNIPVIQMSDLAQKLEFAIKCHGLTAALIGDTRLLECNADQRTFLSAGNKDNACVCLDVEYDFGRRNLFYDRSPIKSEEQTLPFEANCFQFNSSSGPFSHRHVFIEGNKLLLAGTREELTEFKKQTCRLSQVNVKLDLPKLQIFLPNRKFFEILYNRFANDFALFSPKAPIYTRNDTPCSEDAIPPNLTFQKFANDDDGLNLLDDHRESSTPSLSSPHAFAFDIRSNGNTDILIGAKTDEGDSQIALSLNLCELFFVVGYGGDPDLIYTFVTANETNVAHRNLFGDSDDGMHTQSLNCNVLDPEFMNCSPSDVFAKPLSYEELKDTKQTAGDKVYEHDLDKDMHDNNLAVAVKIHTTTDDYTGKQHKDIVLAVTVHNTLVYYRPFTNPEHLWVKQLCNFFDVKDYGVPGYEWPEPIMSLNVHIDNVVLAYDHSLIVPGSPLRARLSIGSCDLSSNIASNMEKYRFQFFLQNTQIHLMKAETGMHVISRKNKYVKFLSMAALQLELNYITCDWEQRDPTDRSPLFEVVCSNIQLHVWTCSDTLVEFTNMILDFMNSKYAQPVTATDEVVEQDPVNLFPKPCEEHQIEEKIAEAMLDGKLLDANVASPSAPEFDTDELVLPSHIRQVLEGNRSDGSTDDDFVIVDETLGSGVRSTTGEPRVRLLQDNFELDNAFMTVPSRAMGNDDVVPPSIPPPLLRYSIQNFTVVLNIYGGNDFGPRVPAKAYSVWDTRSEAPECMRVGSFGGPYRDHTVCVSAKVSGISFTSMLFHTDSPILSTNKVAVTDIEICDHLLTSTIHKLFYQSSPEGQPRRSSAPLLSIRIIEDQERVGKLMVSMLPIRLNFNQNTLEFLMTFKDDVENGLLPPDAPVEAPNPQPDLLDLRRASVSSSTAGTQAPADLLRLSDNPLDDELILADEIDDETEARLNEDGCSRSEDFNSETLRRPRSGMSTAGLRPATDTYFKLFSFSPECVIRLDYDAKQRININHEQGTLFGIVAGIGDLNSTQLKLKRLHCENGLSGIRRCKDYAIEEWTNDIINNQYQNVIETLGPLSSVFGIVNGIRDLFLIPISELRKEDGRVVKGVQRGAKSFGFSTASAFLDAGQWFAAVVNNIAEVAFDIVTPDNHIIERRRREHQSRHAGIPQDFREGFHMAVGTVFEEVKDSARTLQIATREDRENGQIPWRGFLRIATPIVLKQIMLASKATAQFLGGVQATIQPGYHREKMEKHRYNRTVERK